MCAPAAAASKNPPSCPRPRTSKHRRPPSYPTAAALAPIASHPSSDTLLFPPVCVAQLAAPLALQRSWLRPLHAVDLRWRL
eukprot:scaffold143851_cov90-Phaeocystis_antarctica.AAC.1